eukprot:746545-Hanusia_phi.AAC.5
MAWKVMAITRDKGMLMLSCCIAMMGCSMAWIPTSPLFLSSGRMQGSVKSLNSPISNLGKSCDARSTKSGIVGLAMGWTEEERLQREAARQEREEKIRREREERQRKLAEMDETMSQQKATTVSE